MWNCVLFALTCVLLEEYVLGFSTEVLTSCTDFEYQFQGYTYTHHKDGYKVWSHCKFFHPNTEPELCGMSKTWSDVHICDPDLLFYSKSSNTSFGSRIGDVLQDTIDSLYRDCPDKKTTNVQTESVVVALIAVEAVKTPDVTASNLCINDCGEVHPTLKDQESSTDDDQKAAADNFAKQLITNEWKIGKCQNQLLMLYVAQTNKLWIYSGEETQKRFGVDLLSDTTHMMSSIVEDRGDDTSLGEAMLEAVEFLDSKIRENVVDFSSPAVIMLSIYIAFLVLIAGISIFIFIKYAKAE